MNRMNERTTMRYDVLVIGVGPAGLMAAIAASKTAAQKKSARVLVLEKNDSPAKKLLISGSGRCNITHAGPISDFLLHYGNKHRFVKPALYHFTNDHLRDFMARRGLPLKELGDGKLFPVTESSRDVLNVFLQVCRQHKVEIRYSVPVEMVSICDDGFYIQTDEVSFVAKNLIIATGGKSYPTTGSTGDGYIFARNLGHTITELAPALTPVRIRDYPFAGCAGAAFENIPVTVLRNVKKIAENSGDVLLTHHGFSGPGILDLSRSIQTGDTLKLSFVPGTTPDQFENILLQKTANQGKKTIRNILAPEFVPQRFAGAILKQSAMDENLTGAELDRTSRKSLVRIMTEATFTVAALGGFHEAMVTSGGVAISEVNRNTMESRLVPGLFFCGEVLDIDGDTGGYNLQFAFSSGTLAGESIRLAH